MSKRLFLFFSFFFYCAHYRNLLATASQVLGLKVWAITAWLLIFIFNEISLSQEQIDLS